MIHRCARLPEGLVLAADVRRDFSSQLIVSMEVPPPVFHVAHILLPRQTSHSDYNHLSLSITKPLSGRFRHAIHHFLLQIHHNASRNPHRRHAHRRTTRKSPTSVNSGNEPDTSCRQRLDAGAEGNVHRRRAALSK